jgi:polyribonucleotide nucleotidyltransferase
MDAALARINQITYDPQEGDEVEGIIRTIADYGAFVDFGGKTGMLHISEISYSRIDNVADVLKEGDTIKVKIIEVDKKSNKLRLSRKALMEKPEGYVERPSAPRPPRDDRRDDRRGGGRDDRRGGGNDRGGRR